MKSNEYIKILSTKKGQNITVNLERDCKVRAKFKGSNIKKLTRFVCRSGINYENMKSTKEARADGSLPSTNEGLPWGEWNKFPWTISHNGKEYLRLYPSNLNIKPEVSFMVDGKEVSKDEVRDMLLSSELKTSDKPPSCYTVNSDNVKSIS